MKRTIAILTSISMLLCSVPAFPVTARQPSKGTYFLVADKNDNRAILFDLVKEKGNPYGYNSYEISDWSTGEGRYTAASADWDVGDILLYTGDYSYTELPSPNSNYFIMKEDGSVEEVGVLPDTLQDAVQKDENGCFLYKGDDDATAALLAELSGRIAATEPTMPDPLPDPTYYKQDYVVLDKIGSVLYLLEYPCNVTTAAYEDNGANLPTYILKDDDPLFKDIIEQAEWGDIIEYTGTSLISTCLNCWNTLGRDGTPPDDETFVKKGSLLTDNDHVTEVDGERYLAFTSSDQARYLVIRKNGRPSFVPETDLTTSAEPTTRQFVVLDKASYPENTMWHPPIQAHTNLYVLEIPFEGTDKDFNNNGDQLQVYTITDTKDTLFEQLCADAEIGDVITYYGSTLSDNGKWEPMWESMHREPDVKGNYAEADTFTVTGSFFTDEQYADYLTEWHGERHFVLTSTEGTRYVVFTAAYEYPSFFPERYLNDFGDLNHDGIHNASDAAKILIQAAMAGAQDATFLDPRMVEARIIGDLNGDGFSDASDAALLLIYAAYYGAQCEAPADLQSYLYELNDTVKRVTIGYREGLSSEHVTKELLTSPAELETYFTETVTPQNINMTDCLAHRDSAEVLAELMAAYPAAFFETHNLAVFCADEANHNNRQEVRQIETSDGGVTITMHHLDINGGPVEGFYAVLVAVDKSITEVSQITVNETHSRYTG